MLLRNVLEKIGITRGKLQWLLSGPVVSNWFMAPYLTQQQRRSFVHTGDPIRFGTINLAIEHLTKDRIAGSVAECGVYRGVLSKFIHERLPDRQLFLFDTFQGFDGRDSHSASDTRFRDTSVEQVLRRIGDTNNVTVRKGFFPETAAGLENERFAFVMIDFDKYEPTLAALEFFYLRTTPGGFIFVHDYTSPESDWACSRALNSFLAGKPEKPIAIPDAWGTALFRKV